MSNNDIQVRKTTEAQLIERAIKDPAFRAELVADPRAVFARELGLDVPASVDVQVLEETPSTVYLVLPQVVAAAGSELSDAELEAVAGGWSAGQTDCGSCGEPSCGGATQCGTCAGDKCA